MAIQPLKALGGTARIGGLDRPKEDQEKELDGILGLIGKKSLSGLAKVGNLLDLPGSMVRDFIAGQNPFDQILSPFSHENRATGRDILRQGGAVGEKDNWGNFWGGIGAEIALDPLTYLTLGASATTKVGDILKKAGVYDSGIRKAVGATKGPSLIGGAKDLLKGNDLGVIGPRTARTNLTLSDIANQSPLTRQAIESVPGGKDALQTLANERIGTLGKFSGRNFGTGTGAISKAVAQGADLLGHSVRYSTPVRHLTRLFNSDVAGFASEIGQKTGAISKDAERIALSSAKEQVAPLVEKLQNVSVEESDHLFRYLEGVDPATPGIPLPGRLGAVKEDIDRLKDLVSDIRTEELSAGLPSHALDDVVEYFPRARKFFKDDLSRRTGSGGSERMLLDTGNVHQIERTMKNMPGGVSFLNRLSLDKRFSGAYHLENTNPKNWNAVPDQAFINEHLPGFDPAKVPNSRKGVLKERFLREFHDDLPGTEIIRQQRELVDMQLRARSGVRPGNGGQMVDPQDIDKALDTRNWAAEALEANNALFNFVTRLDPRHVKEGIPAYLTNPAEALVARLERGKRSAAAANSIRGLLSQHARLVGEIDGDVVPLQKVLKDAGITGPDAATAMARDIPEDVAARFGTMMESVESTSGFARDATPEQLLVGTLRVPKDIADDVTRYMKEFTSKDSEALNFFDKATNLFKGFVTSVWPAFHGRNLLSGQYQNWMGGAYGKYGEMLPDLFKGTKRIFQGKEIEGAAKIVGGNMTDKEATRQIAQWAYAHNVVGNQGYISDLVGDFTTPAIERIPGAIPQKQAIENVRATFTKGAESPLEKMGWKERLNPINTRGVARDEDKFLLSAIGSDVGARTENLNRMMPFVGFLKQGYSPAEAAKRVKALQVDYSRLTSFERNAMRRAFPFYSFTRNIIPYHIEQLLQNPGGKLAQTIRTANRARDPDKLTPDYVAESAAIPLGTGADGSDQYVTGFGLMAEDPLGFLGGEGVGGTLRSGGLEAASRLNPMFKAPLEWAVGQSFFQKGPQGGRPLDDLDPTVGRTLSNVGQYLRGNTDERVDPVKLPEGAEFLMANSPAARLLTSARKLSDPRKSASNKAINLLTGFSISNISPAAQDVILREKASDLMRDMGAMSFVRNSFSEEQILQMPLEQQAKARQLQSLMKEISNRTKARKQEKLGN